MVLGRIFDPRDEDLILCMVTGPDGDPRPCASSSRPGASAATRSDLMRRDHGEHPNGLIDFALVSTIEHLRDLGCQGVSLNFAALRSVLEGVRGDGPTQRVERWALKKMSSFLQIESLWRFNAKYQPEWLPRYVVYDAVEHLVPVVLAVVAGRVAVGGPRHREDDRRVRTPRPRGLRFPRLVLRQRCDAASARDPSPRRLRSRPSSPRTAHLRTGLNGGRRSFGPWRPKALLAPRV